MTDYKIITSDVSKHLKKIANTSSASSLQAFRELGKVSTANSVLTEKTKELIAMAIAVSSRCNECIGFHAKALVRLGVSFEELCEVLSVAIYMGGGPNAMYASKAIDAFEQFSNEEA